MRLKRKKRIVEDYGIPVSDANRVRKKYNKKGQIIITQTLRKNGMISGITLSFSTAAFSESTAVLRY